VQSACFYIPPAPEPLVRSRVISAGQAMFHPCGGSETKLRQDETILALGEDIRKPALGIH
jgi:hypothetical protein